MVFRTESATRWGCAVNVNVKCKHKAIQPEKNFLEIKDFMKDFKLNLIWNSRKKLFFLQMNVCFISLFSNQ